MRKWKPSLQTMHRCKPLKLLHNQKGTFTLEASMIFPVIFLCTLFFLFTGLLIFHKVHVAYVTFSGSERLAHVWDNSYKDPFTGAFDPDQRDGLYWRWQEGNLLSLLRSQPASISIRTDSANEANSLTERKLQRLNEYFPPGMDGEIHLKNGWLEKKISVRLAQRFRLPVGLTGILGNTWEVEAETLIVDPVEYIRNLQLIQHYGSHFFQQSRVSQLFDQLTKGHNQS